MAGGWAVPPAAGECTVWWAARRPWQRLVAGFDDVERGRISTLRRHDDRDRFATGVWLVRSVTAAALGTEPAAVVVDRRCPHCGHPHGRPRVHAPSGEELRTSVTHAGDAVGLAVAWVGEPVRSSTDDSDGCGIGLDVESPDASARLAHLDPDLLGSSETSNHVDDDRHRRAALHRWVTKEAALKAAGVGHRVDLGAVDLHDDGHSLRLRRWPVDVPPTRVHLVDLEPPAPGHLAVLAVIARAAPRVQQRRAPGPERPARRRTYRESLDRGKIDGDRDERGSAP